MGERRKVFRIEEMAAPRLNRQAEHSQPGELAELVQELSALRAMLAAMPGRPARTDSAAAPQDGIERLMSALRLVHSAMGGPPHEDAGRDGRRSSTPPAAPVARIAEELQAVVACAEQATQKILAATEDIDQAANTLSATLKTDGEQGLAQDIRDRVIQIFEACNYQDLASQRVTKVMATLGRMERQIARTLDELGRAQSAPPLHGPRLPTDRGHVSQNEVDSMFASELKSA